jgi:hypothetical protein
MPVTWAMIKKLIFYVLTSKYGTLRTERLWNADLNRTVAICIFFAADRVELWLSYSDQAMIYRTINDWPWLRYFIPACVCEAGLALLLQLFADSDPIRDNVFHLVFYLMWIWYECVVILLKFSPFRQWRENRKHCIEWWRNYQDADWSPT